MKLVIINKSQYDTQSIKNFYKPIIEHEGLTDAPVEIKARHGNCRSRAYIGKVFYAQALNAPPNKLGMHYSCTLVLPTPDKWTEPKDIESSRKYLIQVAIHEFGHCRGLRHKDMAQYNTLDISWFPKNLWLMPKRAAAPKPPRNLKVERYNKACVKVKEFERKVKHSTTLLKKWKEKKMYYEKRGIGSE